MLRIVLIAIFLLSAFCIIWAMGGYDVSLKIINKVMRIKPVKYTEYKYTVTVMIVAHNEESVIKEKLENVIDNDYPKEKIKYLIASDNSSDNTNLIVEQFIKEHEAISMRLYTSKEHKGKTNAQNEAQELVDTDILVMTDANSMFKKDTISKLISSFSIDDIVYVCGALLYTNTENGTANLESTYWNKELQSRFIESSIKTITAGNGAVYACRNSAYIKIPPIECHDSSMPYYYGIHGLRAVFNEKAIAYEKAGENTEDEYKRKVRMNRVILKHIKNGIKAMNIFKYGWFSYFYFGHRTARYLLWLNHLLLFIANIFLIRVHGIFLLFFIGQVLFYIVSVCGYRFKIKNRFVNLAYYYCMTILAQWVGVYHCIMGKSEAVWEKAKSTR